MSLDSHSYSPSLKYYVLFCTPTLARLDISALWLVSCPYPRLWLAGLGPDHGHTNNWPTIPGPEPEPRRVWGQGATGVSRPSLASRSTASTTGDTRQNTTQLDIVCSQNKSLIWIQKNTKICYMYMHIRPQWTAYSCKTLCSHLSQQSILLRHECLCIDLVKFTLIWV